MRKISLDKKAQSLGGLYGGILVIASIGILLALVLYILSSIGTNLLVKNTVGAAVNETVTSSATTGISANLLAGSYAAGSCGTITAVYNGTTSGLSIGLGNFTQTGCGVVNASDMSTFHTGLFFNYPYTYSASTTSSNATTTMVGQFVDFIPWLGIILLVLAAGVVLFFVIRSFAGGGRQAGV